MPNRARDLTPERKAAMEAELRLYGRLTHQALMDQKVHIARCVARGLSEREVAAVYGISASQAHKWKVEGEAELIRLRSQQGEP